MIKRFTQFFKRKKEIRKSITPEGCIDDSIEDYFNDFSDEFDLDLRIYKRKGGDPSGIDDRCFIVMDRKSKISKNDLSKIPILVKKLKDVLKRLEINNFLVLNKQIVPSDKQSTISFNVFEPGLTMRGRLHTASISLKHMDSLHTELMRYSTFSSISDLSIIIYLY